MTVEDDDFDLPWFPFYPGDYLSSSRVARMTLEEQGAYLRLLCYQWQDGSIPSDPDERARLLAVPGEAQARLWPRLEPCFEENEDGNLVNPRLQQERQTALNRKRKLSRAGRKGREKQLSGGRPGGGPREAQTTSGGGPGNSQSQPQKENTQSARVRDVLWPVYLEELGGNGRQPSLTDKRRKKLNALDEEHLSDDPDEAAEEFREILKAVQNSEFHMSKRDYQYPDSLFRNEERRDKWAAKAENGDGSGGDKGMAGNITRGVM